MQQMGIGPGQQVIPGQVPAVVSISIVLNDGVFSLTNIKISNSFLPFAKFFFVSR